MRPQLTKAGASVAILTLLFSAAVILLATLLIVDNRKTALLDSEAQAERFVNGAEAAVNRSLMGIDVMLAGADNMLGLSNLIAEWIDIPAANRLLQTSMRQNLLVRQVVLITPEGKVLASSDPGGSNLVLNLPKGFIHEALQQPVSTLIISSPAVSFTSSERVLYFARHIKLADNSYLLALAEVPISQLTTILVQGVDIKGLEATLERSNGQLLASMPASESLLGTQLPRPPERTAAAEGALRLPARLSGASAIVMVRSMLYRDFLITASIPIASALQEWARDSWYIAGIALVFVLMILAAGGFAIRHLNQLAKAQETVARAKETLDQALESMESGFILLDAEFQVVTWNRRYLEMFPLLKDLIAPLLPFRVLLEKTSIHQIQHASDEQRMEWVENRMSMLRKRTESHELTQLDGTVIEITERMTPDQGIVIVYQDVTHLRRARAEIEQLAFYDPLTGLPNRRMLTDRLHQAMIVCARNGRYGALLFMDLDHFKTLNDTSGHDMGDLLLQQVANRLNDSVREMDTVARLGGDEFVVMLLDLGPGELEATAQARQVGENLLTNLNQPYILQNTVHRNSCSAGATLFNGHQQSPADLLKQADIAMYQVKSSGRDALCFFDPGMLTAITARAELERDLRLALTKNQFTLHYQIQVEQDGQAVGAEVLIRWNHPIRGLVSPMQFIGLAEETGLIVPIGLWVLHTACLQLKTWESQSAMAHLQLAVNVSAMQFRQPDFVSQVKTQLASTGARSERLKLELTESLVLDNVQDTIDKMNQLKALGVRFSMDDFGTGHSSLAYLTRLPLDQLKIDQSFIRNIGLQATDSVIIDTIIGMAHNLGLEVIAEGVETSQQRDFLLQHGCHMFQGYMFSKPIPANEFDGLLMSMDSMHWRGSGPG